MQSNTKVPIIISIIALVVSVVNIALTSPIIIDIYTKPKLSVTEVNREIDGNTFHTMFVAKNEGSGTARNVELVINAHAKDIIQPRQGFTGEISEKDNGPSFKTVTFKATFLPAEDFISFIITGSKDSLISDSKAYNIKDHSPSNLTIPSVVSIKSEKGIGKIHHQPPWFQANFK
jgi:hypothetical protein